MKLRAYPTTQILYDKVFPEVLHIFQVDVINLKVQLLAFIRLEYLIDSFLEETALELTTLWGKTKECAWTITSLLPTSYDKAICLVEACFWNWFFHGFFV